MIFVKKGKQQKPFSLEECKVLIIEQRGIINTGDSRVNLTSEIDAWI